MWLRGFTAVALQPSGVLLDVAGEARTPVLRFGGAVFNDTFVGAGARVAVTPVHVDTALRISTQLIDVLPITLEAYHSTYWESPWGLVPIDSVDQTSTLARKPLYQADEDFSGEAWALAINPTLQAKAGPVIAFSDWTLTLLQIRPERADPAWVFEPYRGLALAYDDRVFEHTSAILAEPSDGEERFLLRLGPVLRGKYSVETPDETLTFGGLAQWRPARSESAPTLTLLVTPYLIDPDFLGPMPNIALVVSIADTVTLGQPVP